MESKKKNSKTQRIPELDVLAYKELALRTPKMAFSLLPGIALVTFITDIKTMAPEAAGLFTAVYFLLGLYRLNLAKIFDDEYPKNPIAWVRRFSVVMIVSATGLGAVLPLIFWKTGASWTFIICLLSTAGITSSSVGSLSPRLGLFRIYVSLVKLPAIISLIAFGSPREMGLGLLLLAFLIQLFVLGRYFHTEFWANLTRAHLLKKRAQDLEVANAEVKSANQSQSEFMANMSHEIRTPLNGILGLTDLVLESELDSQQEEYLRIVRTSGQSLMQIINEVLDFSKIESGAMELESAVFSLPDLMRKVAVAGELKCRDQGNKLFLEMDSDLPKEVVGDSHRLWQILTNLVSNAVKFTKLGTITLKGTLDRRQDGLVAFTLSVQDTGVGIPHEAQSQIFSAFKQADGSTTRSFEGTGLGLAISHQLAELMGGKITLESEPGKGSLFRVLLALPEAQAPVDETDFRSEDAQAEGDENSLEGLKVLLVEDNTINAKLATRLLEKSGIHVTWAPDGQEAVNEFMKSRFDLILMDIQMPVLDGFGATRAIRLAETSRGGHIPILALTAHAMEGYREKCLDADMDDYLTKPLQPKVLREALERWNPLSLNSTP